MRTKEQIMSIIGHKGWNTYAKNFDQIVNILADYAITNNNINLAILHSAAKWLNKELVDNPAITKNGVIENIIIYGRGKDKAPAYTFNNGKLISFDIIARD